MALAGGVAFNSVANGKILNNTEFEEIYIQSAAGDAGTALGSASYVYNSILNNERHFVMSSSYWGPSYSDSEIEKALIANGISFRKLSDNDLFFNTATAIAELALRMELDIVPLKLLRNKGYGHEITFLPKLAFPNKKLSHENKVKDILNKINNQLSSWIIKNPEQWLWIHRRWGKKYKL